jgi:uncharacterized protein
MSADPRPPAYFDSSALVKRYVSEAGSAAARRLLVEYRVFSSRLAPLEITSAVRRRQAQRLLSKAQFADILRAVRDDQSYWELADLDRGVLNHAQELLRSANVRTLDALHISSASSTQTALSVDLPFITADARQRDVARQVGLKVTWVE